MAGRRGPYKRYLEDDNAPIPKRTKSLYDAQHQQGAHGNNDFEVGQQARAVENAENGNIFRRGEGVQNYPIELGLERNEVGGLLFDQEHGNIVAEDHGAHIMHQNEVDVLEDQQLGQEQILFLDEDQRIQRDRRDSNEGSEEESNEDHSDENSIVEGNENNCMDNQTRNADDQSEVHSSSHSEAESDTDLARDLLEAEGECDGRRLLEVAVRQDNPRVLRADVAATSGQEQEADNDNAVLDGDNQDNPNHAENQEIGLDEYLEDDEDEIINQVQQDIDQPDNNQQGDNHAERVGEEENVEPAHAENPESHPALKRALGTDSFTTPISDQVIVSPAEALLMTLNMAEQNHLTLKAFIDSVKLLNSLFPAPVIPNTLYMLDKLLHSSAGILRYFYCNSCSFAFGKRDNEVDHFLVCPECEVVNKIQDLSAATYLVVFMLQPQIELLLKKEKVREALKSPKQLTEGRDPNVFSDIYDGKVYKDFANSITEEPNTTVISLIGNTDGTPLFKSSTYSIWPFFHSINELPPKIRMKHLLLGGLWFGKKKPPMDLYLEPIVDHLVELSKGFAIEVHNAEVLMKVFMLGLCVDSGARGAVQGLNTHSGYYSCNWCEISGEYDGKVVFTFPEIPPKKRTHENFVEYASECLENESLAYVYGVQYLSPLASLPKFDLVNGMVLDYAHNMLYGLSRTILEEWLSNTERGYYIGAPDDILLLDTKIMKIRPPIEVRKPIRKVSERAHWSMREFENWTLDYSIPVLSGILPLKYLEHWTYFVQVMFLLSREKITRDNIDLACKLALRFGRDTEFLYGKSHMTYNLHIFCQHIAENSVRWGPLWAANTFCFESGNKDLKGLLHAQRGVAHQIHRALSYRQASSILEVTCGSQRTETYKSSIAGKVNKMTRYTPAPECVLIGTSKPFTPTDEENYLIEQSESNIDISHCVVFQKVIVRNCVYVTRELALNKKFDNGYAITDDNKIIGITKFILDQSSENVYVFFNEISSEPFLRMPQGIRVPPSDHCIRVITLMGRRLHLISVNRLKSVCNVTHMNEKIYVSEFPNIYNVF